MSEQKENKALTLKVNEKGEILAETIDMLLQKAQILIKTGFAPKAYKTPAELVGALLFCRQLGLPDTAIAKIYVVHGSPCAFGELPLAMAKRASDFGEFVEFFIDSNGIKICFENKNIGAEVHAAVCRIKRKSCEEWGEYFFTRQDAAKAGLIKNVWHQYFNDLIRLKARSRALKANYADALQGLQQAEDLYQDFESKRFEKEAIQLDDLRQIGENGSAEAQTTSRQVNAEGCEAAQMPDLPQSNSGDPSHN